MPDWKGVFFASMGPQSVVHPVGGEGDCAMITRVMVLLLFAGSIWGCVASARDDVSLRDAFQEREAAYAKLANAMTTYCAVRHSSLEVRQTCVVDKRVELLHIRQLNEEAMGQLPSDPPRSPGRGKGKTFPLIKCERAGGQTTCQRLSRAFMEGLSY